VPAGAADLCGQQCAQPGRVCVSGEGVEEQGRAERGVQDPGVPVRGGLPGLLQGTVGAVAILQDQGADTAADAPGAGMQVGVVGGQVFGPRQVPFGGVTVAAERVGDPFDELTAGQDRCLVEPLRGLPDLSRQSDALGGASGHGVGGGEVEPG
jgi:hypothetical protein